MSRKRVNPHKSFMVFNAVLFIAVLVVTGIFLYLAYAFKRSTEKKEKTYQEAYQIEIKSDFSGESLSFYLNDSLLLNRTMPDSALEISIHRFAEENALIVVDNATEKMRPFNLNKEGGKIIVKKEKGEVVIEDTPSRF
jgi:hypothetical protein